MFATPVVNRRSLSIVALVLAALLLSGVAVTAQGPQPQGPHSASGRASPSDAGQQSGCRPLISDEPIDQPAVHGRQDTRQQ